MSEQDSSDDKAAVDVFEQWAEEVRLEREPGQFYRTSNPDVWLAWRAAEQHWREEQRRDDLAAVEGLLNRPYSLQTTPENVGYMQGYTEACGEILSRIRRITESGSSEG